MEKELGNEVLEIPRISTVKQSKIWYEAIRNRKKRAMKINLDLDYSSEKKNEKKYKKKKKKVTDQEKSKSNQSHAVFQCNIVYKLDRPIKAVTPYQLGLSRLIAVNNYSARYGNRNTIIISCIWKVTTFFGLFQFCFKIISLICIVRIQSRGISMWNHCTKFVSLFCQLTCRAWRLSLRAELVKVLTCDLEISEFKRQSPYSTSFISTSMC